MVLLFLILHGRSSPDAYTYSKDIMINYSMGIEKGKRFLTRKQQKPQRRSSAIWGDFHAKGRCGEFDCEIALESGGVNAIYYNLICIDT
jgi:hypothetical protein